MEFYGNEDSRRFQSTLPQGERRGHRPFCDHFGDFNPRSHKGSDLSRRPWVDDRDISIHAPTRGATGVDVSMFSLMDTFQSTLPQGERQKNSGRLFVLGDFNPRSHKGSDILDVDVIPAHTISIHAPTRGATIRLFPSVLHPNRNFNPRSHKGSDAGISITWTIKIFQSTLPQGERRCGEAPRSA